MQRDRQQGVGQVRALLAAACCIVLAACAAGGKKAAAPAAAPESAGGGGMAPAPHDQIQELEDQITASRTELKLAEPSEADLQGVAAVPMGALPSTQDAKCRPAQNETCKTSC